VVDGITPLRGEDPTLYSPGLYSLLTVYSSYIIYPLAFSTNRRPPAAPAYIKPSWYNTVTAADGFPIHHRPPLVFPSYHSSPLLDNNTLHTVTVLFSQAFFFFGIALFLPDVYKECLYIHFNMLI
jgi:hypothetical protein